ncbi:glucose 1-dehydrogenase [Marivita sp. XM-24bin2]|jgi:2-deoxy-D-gluconate 3-dehydrogenase|uniref:glucose 1-dehydrogenase n=1 Tax=unclassified Marivita TaxID=2632480 RepID=UPI000D7A84AC|nr:glucose 1-dehydrogenase [Marivita sp. XM-24bin2]MCR9108829.1 glucose 1-dehydrogenase [Paracoccaceae bacterium]PWL34039.1 MAG: 2-deoxy-D-gluconate 3-dehydrogenase [Marivita sp. XM-24bin2]
MANLFDLTGRKALVTGGATGIGEGIALALAEAGADVALTYRSHAPEDTLAKIEAVGRKGAAVKADFVDMDEAAASDVVGFASDALGGLDILVNNAGIIHREDSSEMPLEEWRRVLSVNLDSVWLLSQAAGKQMLAQGSGKIVIVSSVLGSQGGLRVPAYASSKHAVLGLTKALCNEWAPQGINVNAIAPGYTATDNTQALRDDPDRSKTLLERIPAGRFAEPSEIAGAAVFLASDAAAYCHGSVVTVDGGWLAR